MGSAESKPKPLALQKAFRALLKACATRGITLRVTCGICGCSNVPVTGRGTYDAHSDARVIRAWRKPKCDSRGVFVPVELVMAAAREWAGNSRRIATERRAEAELAMTRAASLDAWAGEVEKAIGGVEKQAEVSP